MDERRHEAGQASVEVVASVPVLILAGLLLFQVLAIGYTVTLADGASEAGALALAAGKRAEPAVRGALPGWARERYTVRTTGGSRVEVSVRPPSPIAALSHRMKISSSAAIHKGP